MKSHSGPYTDSECPRALPWSSLWILRIAPRPGTPHLEGGCSITASDQRLWTPRFPSFSCTDLVLASLMHHARHLGCAPCHLLCKASLLFSFSNYSGDMWHCHSDATSVALKTGLRDTSRGELSVVQNGSRNSHGGGMTIRVAISVRVG